jgi:hypothetical protein
MSDNPAIQFKFGLRQPVKINASGETGEVIGRADYAYSENAYYLRYRAGDGRAVETWWSESALSAA